MPQPLNYRRRLLAVVDAFLDPSESSHARAHRLIKRLYQDPRRSVTTIDGLVWHRLLDALSESAFSTDPANLWRTVHDTLTHGSLELHRAYLSYDYRPEFTDEEGEWHARLTDLASWLQTRPFPVQQRGLLPRGDESAPQAEYERRVRAIQALAERTPMPTHLGEETLHHFIMRTAAAVLTGINSWQSTRLGYLVVATPYTEYHWDPANPKDARPPNADASVEWSARALRAVTMQDWVWLTWQITASSYLVSVH